MIWLWILRLFCHLYSFKYIIKLFLNHLSFLLSLISKSYLLYSDWLISVSFLPSPIIHKWFTLFLPAVESFDVAQSFLSFFRQYTCNYLFVYKKLLIKIKKKYHIVCYMSSSPYLKTIIQIFFLIWFDMMTYNRVHTLLILFLLFKSQFVVHDLVYRAKKKEKKWKKGRENMAMKKKGYNHQKVRYT